MKITKIELKRMLHIVLCLYFFLYHSYVPVLHEEFEIELYIPEPESYFAFVPLKAAC